MKDSKRSAKPALWLILSIIAAGSMEFYVAKIWGAGQSTHFSDLYAPWWGAHELLLHGRNPYTRAVAHEIQSVIYGAPPATTGLGDPSDVAGGFAYPLYAAFLLWPTVHMDFSSAQVLFFFASMVATVGSLALWVHLFRFRGPPMEWLTLAVFTLGSFPVLQGMRLLNLSLIAAGLLTLSVALLTRDHFIPAGLLLAASTFKPQFNFVLVLWLAVWAVSDWRRRQAFAWSFVASMLLLVGTSEWLLPGWIGDFLRVMRAYRQYTFGHSLLDVWFTPRAGPFIAVALLVAVFALCWKYRSHGTNSPAFLAAVSIMLAATLVVIPTLAPHTQILLLPGFLFMYRYREKLWKARVPRLVMISVWLLLAWPWMAATGFTLASAVFSVRAMLRWWSVPLYTSPLWPLAVLLALACLIRIQSWANEIAN